VSPVLLNIVVEKIFDVETCTSYVVALAAAFHESLVAINWLVALLLGALSVGAAGSARGATVVKLLAADHALVPAVLVALTLQ
jgi:hypothetical protein